MPKHRSKGVEQREWLFWGECHGAGRERMRTGRGEYYLVLCESLARIYGQNTVRMNEGGEENCQAPQAR